MDGDLTFVVPVRHPDSVEDWTAVKRRLSQTLQSVAGQESGRWRCVVVANEGADLPGLPPNVSVVRVGLPFMPLPSAREGQEGRNEAVRADKGRRVLHGLMAARPTGHVMVVDDDDFVSRRLAAHVASEPHAPGWFIDSGFVFGGSGWMYAFPRGFNGLCGTSLIVRADLLRLPATLEDAEETWTRRWLGSHVHLRRDLELSGTPLSPLPFPGAVYRVGHHDNTSGSPTIRAWFFRKHLLVTRPHRFAMRLTNLRPLRAKYRVEFFGEPAD